MLLALASLALAGVIGREAIDLDGAVTRADAAVVVSLGTPAMVPVEVPVPGGDDKDCGTYSYGVWPVTVTEVVIAPVKGPSLAEGTALDVFPANTPGLVKLTRRACLEGGSRSPVWASYDGIEPEDGGTALVLLRWEAPYGWLEAASGTWLDPEDAKRIGKKGGGSVLLTSGAAGEPVYEDLLCRTDAQCAVDTVHCSVCPPCPDPPGEALNTEAVRWFEEACAAWSTGHPETDCEACGLPPGPVGVEGARCVDMRCTGGPE